MNTLRTVLCPLEFDSAHEGALQTATQLSQSFGTRLVLHHHEARSAHGNGPSFEPGASVPERLGDLLAKLPPGLHYDVRVTRGGESSVLLGLARTLPADLVVLDGAVEPTEGSVTDTLIGQAPCTVVATAESERPAGPSPDAPLLVAVGTERSLAVLDYAVDLAEREGLAVHVVHVLGSTWRLMTRELRKEVAEAVSKRMRARLGRSLADRTRIHIGVGSVAEEIVRIAEEIDARFTVLGTRSRGRSTATGLCKEVLGRSPCPVWFVPPGPSRTRVRRTDPLDRRMPLTGVS